MMRPQRCFSSMTVAADIFVRNATTFGVLLSLYASAQSGIHDSASRVLQTQQSRHGPATACAWCTSLLTDGGAERREKSTALFARRWQIRRCAYSNAAIASEMQDKSLVDQLFPDVVVTCRVS